MKDIEYKVFDESIGCLNVQNYIDECMKVYLGRNPYEHADLKDIEAYYGRGFMCALRGNDIVGTVGVVKSGKTWELKRFYVKSEYTCNGIGHHIYLMAEAYVKSNGGSKISLYCGDVLKSAHRFYVKHGYNRVESMDKYRDYYFEKVLCL